MKLLLSLIIAFLHLTGFSQIRHIEVKAHITSDGITTATSPDYVQSIIDRSNQKFENSNSTIRFFLCGEVDTVYHAPLTQLTEDDFVANDKPGAINLWIIDYVMPPASAFATIFPARVTGLDFSVLGFSAHEFGHVLTLLHTHEIGSGIELVDGSNCATAGDYVCDTPADPGLSVPGMVDENCNYVGTVTDPNGDPYTPLANNIMSGSGCRLLFTSGQNNRMNDYLDNAGFFFNIHSSDYGISSIPTEYCVEDNTGYALTSLGSGGVISGDGIVGSQFYPNIAGPGVHALECTYPSTNVVQTDFVEKRFSANTNDTLSDFWQSYTCYNSGDLDEVFFLLKLQSDENITINVYEGQGVLGTLLHTQNNFVLDDGLFGWRSFSIPPGVSFNTGQVYTIRVSTSVLPCIAKNYFGTSIPGAISSKDLLVSSPPGYSMTYSSVFKLNGPNPCGNTFYRYVLVSSPTPNFGMMNELNPEYCEGTAPIILTGQPASGTFYVNGSVDSLFRPSVLGNGQHTIDFISTDTHGCFDTLTKIIQITPFVVDFITPPDSTYCLSDPDVALVGNNLGGEITINGINDSILSPLSLGLGTHEVQYSYMEIADTVEFIGTIHNDVGVISWPRPLLELDSVVWQEFKVDSSSVLLALNGYMLYWAGITTENSLWLGAYSDNVLLKRDTLSYVEPIPGSTYYGPTPLFFDANHVSLEKDSVYTFSIRWLSGSNTFSDPKHTRSANNVYPDGRSSWDTVGMAEYDLFFDITLGMETICEDSIEYQVEVIDCETGLNELSKSDVLVFPNPATNQVEIVQTSNTGSIEIYDYSGKLVIYRLIHEEHTYLDLNYLSPGIYAVKVQTPKGIATIKLALY